MGVIPLQIQNYVELYEIHFNPVLQQSSRMARQPPFPVLPSVTCELAEGTLCPIVHIINEDVE